MGLDLRIPIGWFFLTLGVILAGYGMMTNGNVEMYKSSLDMNINLIWGGVLLLFGLAMLIPALIARKNNNNK